MKTFLLSLTLVLGSQQLSAQFHHNLELGGSNYTGASITTEYHINIYDEGKVYIAPKLGLGQIVWWDNVNSIQLGLAIGQNLNPGNAIEISSNASYLFTGLFYKADPDESYYPLNSAREDGNLLLYSSIDYKVISSNKLRYTFGAGLLMRYQGFRENGKLGYSGDLAPMLKLGIGI